MIGKKILNYELKSLLGEGGMGNVYLAEHTQLGRKVAIKSLHQQLVKNEGLRTRFKNEASTMAHLQHPKIVALYDYVEEADGLYLIMEYVDGMPLDEYIRSKSGPIPSEKAIPMMSQILDAFSYAHSKGIVHRDIKPSNILITESGDIKILDFGIAKMLSDAGNKLTKTGTQMGTVFYMSPEQVQGKEIDIRSDIYSLGVTLYQMLTGASPYDGMTTEFEVYSKIVAEPLPAASNVYPGVPDFLDKVILKATSKNKDDRFQTCMDFSNTLSSKEIASKIQVKREEPQKPKSKPEQTNEKNKKSWLVPIIFLIICSALSALIYINFKYEPYYDEYSSDFDDTEMSNDPNNETIEPAAEVPYYPADSAAAAPAPATDASEYSADPPASAENKVVEFFNNSNYNVSIAYAFYDRGWETIGWYNAEPGKSVSITLPSSFTENEIYWYANNSNNAEYIGSDGYFCTVNDAFHYYSIEEYCSGKKGFFKLNLAGTYTSQSLGN